MIDENPGVTMDQTLSVEDCLKNAEECIQLAQATSDPELRDQYLEVAGHLVRLAGVLDKGPSEIPHRESEQEIQLKRAVVEGKW